VGLAALGVARHPNGILPLLRERWRGAMEQPFVTGAVLGALVLAWCLRLAKVMENWPWLAVCAAGLVVLVVATELRPHDVATGAGTTATSATGPSDREGVTPTPVG
jgi:hypothetical protein